MKAGFAHCIAESWCAHVVPYDGNERNFLVLSWIFSADCRRQNSFVDVTFFISWPVCCLLPVKARTTAVFTYNRLILYYTKCQLYKVPHCLGCPLSSAIGWCNRLILLQYWWGTSWPLLECLSSPLWEHLV